MRNARMSALVSIAAAFVLSSPVSGAEDEIVRARTKILSCADPNVAVGSAEFLEHPSDEGVKVVGVFVSVRGLTPGKHAVHIHEVGACATSTAPCSEAGSHLDLGPFGHNIPVTANHPYHSGDLVNIRVRENGKGTLATVTSRIALSPVNLSILDENGSSIVIHQLPDTYCPDPSLGDANCAGGGRVACGIIKLVN
jgi:Cu-Zn family superoxide dismutase